MSKDIYFAMYEEQKRLYEQIKAILRKQREFDATQFILVCHECAEEFPDEAEMGMVEAHFELAHEHDNVVLDLVWIGEGSPPRERG